MNDELHSQIMDRVDAVSDDLIQTSRAIHGRPELAFKEFFARKTLTNVLERHGLEQATGVFTLETAFEARLQGEKPGPTVAILAEYDALPEIGHACGHNIIAAAALGATLGLQAVMTALPGQINLLGTPAEEQGGGKELMARAGAFDGVSAAMMIHPAGVNLASMPCISVANVEVTYHGIAAHAAAMPHAGVNALDGLLLAYQAISNLRQHIRSTERIHGIISEGGTAPNVVPDRTKAQFLVRAANETELAPLKLRVHSCFEAGAKGSGCEVEVVWGDVDYMDLNTNWPLAERFQDHAESLGRDFFPFEKAAKLGAGSTDMGNISYRVPSIHPMLAVAPPNIAIHNPEFEKWAGSPMGDLAVLDGAKALALTVADYLMSPDLQRKVSTAFTASQEIAY